MITQLHGASAKHIEDLYYQRWGFASPAPTWYGDAPQSMRDYRHCDTFGYWIVSGNHPYFLGKYIADALEKLNELFL